MKRRAEKSKNARTKREKGERKINVQAERKNKTVGEK